MKKILLLVAGFALCFASAAQADNAKANLPVKKEKATLKRFNENDPKTTADNTITVNKDGKEVELKVNDKWNNNNLNPFFRKDVNLTSHYDPSNGDFIVTHVEPFN